MGRERAEDAQGERSVVYCVVPRDVAPRLHARLRNHFRDDPDVEVVVEQRAADQRSGLERRERETDEPPRERRLVRNADGRRVADRRAPLIPVEAPAELPRAARAVADRIVFVERLAPGTQKAEDEDSARVVIRFQAGEREVFDQLYMRYFDRVYGYLRVVLKDAHEAEDATQQVFAQVLEALPKYERRSQPFRAWLFTIVRHYALNRLTAISRLELRDPLDLSRERDQPAPDGDAHATVLDWITDRDLMLFVERLPLAQRQVLMLRYMLDMTTSEIAEVLGRSHEDVRVLQHRALRFLQDRLTALGRGPRRGGLIRSRRRRQQSGVLRLRRFALH